MKLFPDTKIERKFFGKNGKIIFQRNNLSVDKFTVSEQGLEFYDIGRVHEIDYKLRIIFQKGIIPTELKMKSSGFRIHGSNHHFGIEIRDIDKKFPRKISGNVNLIKYELHLSGNRDSVSYVNNKKVNAYDPKKYGVHTDGESKKGIAIPSSVSWSISHPFQGGSVTPK